MADDAPEASPSPPKPPAGGAKEADDQGPVQSEDGGAKAGDGEFIRREPNAPVNVANAIWKGLTQPRPVARPDIVP